ncbi:zinc finger protein CONSTANS-LIKE 6-like [Durio zibethinus]|uniref:Zinc finger protein CONSTANS-LIKE 6-like n=1 Tax=Durio zibethinus TaxID=66656 RepID=A0A6P5YKC4_DURZI|nr:zinc finger protein CONSTANS-LIKE 6-like [Durio zibethinus]
MCNKNITCRRRRKSKSSSFSLKPSRKTRTKTRKPKYLSLLHLEESLPQMSLINNSSNSQIKEQEQLNLFPLHPGNSDEDRDTQYDNVSLLFNTTEKDNFHAVTLHGLLDEKSSDNYKNETTTTTVTSDESPLSSPSLTYGYSCEDHARLSLVRSAMKGRKERDESEEKWVVYSEVVEEVSSCGAGGGGGSGCGDGGAWCRKKKMKKLLALKLDYDEIMNAWSDKGPLYIEGDSPQTVPDLLHPSTHVLMDGVSHLWMVPEMVSNNASSFKIKEEFDGKEDWKRGHREASVLRYKEKRQNRLFSKRIRYEVRKLNAEKRPRLKGRFVKRA